MTLPGKCERKIVVDTNVILFDALAINKFKAADIYIPFSVIEEIDRFKRDLGENGRNARHFSRFVDVLRDKGSLAKAQLSTTPSPLCS
jgi:PhoH-like ATPase